VKADRPSGRFGRWRTRLYGILGEIHMALVTVAGCLIVLGGILAYGYQLEFDTTVLLFCLGYLICDLIRITFLRGKTISLGFPLILMAFLILDSPVLALLIAVTGSLFSEVVYSKLLSKQRRPMGMTVARALFSSGHHAIAGAGALYAFSLTKVWIVSWLEVFHIQAIAVFVVVYSLLSILLIWPHDYRVYRVLTPDEGPFVRIDLLVTILLAPFPLVAFYLYDLFEGQTPKVVAIVGILPPLFFLLFYLARKFAQSEEERMWLEVREFVRVQLGSPANMTEMVQQIVRVVDKLVRYRWCAVYQRSGDSLDLLATTRASGEIVYCNGTESTTVDEEGEESACEENVIWPRRIALGEGYLGKMARTFQFQPCYAFEETPPAVPCDPHLPRKTAMVPVPIGLWERDDGGEERLALVGLVALARPKRMFTIVDQERVEALGTQAGGAFLAVQRLEDALRQLYQRVEAYTREPEKVRQAMQDLISMQVNVAQILSVVAERSFRGNWRAVLRGLVRGRKEGELGLTPEMLSEIYHQVRDEAPGMPPLNTNIVGLLQTVTSSLSLAFSLPYQWPDVQRGTEFKELYDVLLNALEANTVSRIVALDSLMVTRMRALDKKLPEVRAILPTAAITALHALRTVIQLLSNYQTTQDPATKRYALSRALDEVTQQEASAHSEIQDPERLIFIQVLSGWRTAITNALEELSREPVRLSLWLRSNQALPLDEVVVALFLRNTGPGTAYRVVARLLPTEDYEVIDGELDLGSIPAGGLSEIEFTLRPQTSGPLRLRFEVAFNDQERKGKVEEFADLMHLGESLAPFVEIPNPYTPGLPLRPGSLTFVGRDDIFKFVRQNAATLVRRAILVLVGERRTGKTSILQQLPARLNDPRYVPVYVDGNGLGIDPGIGNFFLTLAEDIADALKREGISTERITLQDLGDSPQHYFERTFMPRVREAIGERTLLLTIDEFEELGARVRSGALPDAVFPALRHLMQHGEQLAFIFAGTHKIEEMIGGYWSVLFNVATYRRVSFLAREAVIRLITEPVQPYGMRYDNLALEEVLQLTAGHPFFTQLLCNILVNQCNDNERNYVTIQGVRRAQDELLEAGQAHLTYIWQTSDQEARLCLAALADLRSRMDQLTAAAIANRLGDFQVVLDPGQVAQTMDALKSREIVREIMGNPVTYDLTAQLYRHWLLRYKSLSKVVEETSYVTADGFQPVR
jgi:hypothetical protein